MTNSVVFYLLQCSPTGVSWYSHTIFPLRSPSGTYICSSFITTPSFINHSSSQRFFISTFFNSSTAFTTLLSPFCALLILSLRFPFSTSVSVSLTYSGLISVLFSLSFSTPFCQSGLLLSLSTFSILFPRICFKMKSNCDRYNTYLAYF